VYLVINTHAQSLLRIPTDRIHTTHNHHRIANRQDEAHRRANHQLSLLPQSAQRARARPSRYALHPHGFLNGTDHYTCIEKKSQLIHFPFAFPLGHKIPAIENLGAAREQECIDFTDNDISVLTNFPQSPRLQTLLCARNRIQRIEKNVTKSVPALNTLVLTQNNVAELADLEVLRGFEKLTFLSLVDNPVANKEVCMR